VIANLLLCDNYFMAEAKLIRVTQPDQKGGTVHIVPAANKGTYLQRNAALLKGRNKGHDRPHLVVEIEDLTEEEHRAYYDKIYKEAAALSAKAKRSAFEAPKAQGVSDATVQMLIQQNSDLMKELAELKKGQSNGKREKAKQAL
jgi:hypothetical protein